MKMGQSTQNSEVGQVHGVRPVPHVHLREHSRNNGKWDSELKACENGTVNSERVKMGQ